LRVGRFGWVQPLFSCHPEYQKNKVPYEYLSESGENHTVNSVSAANGHGEAVSKT
jgi:hypothetical protein